MGVKGMTSRCETRQPWLSYPRRQPTNDSNIRDVKPDSDRERGRVGAELVVHGAREPSAERHAANVAEEPDGHAPGGFAGGKELAQDHHVGGDDAAESGTEGPCHR